MNLPPSNGLGVLGFGISEANSNEYVRTYREKIRTAKPIGKFVNNRFAVLRMALCSPNDREALDLQGANVKMYTQHTRELFAPWIDGKPPASYRKIIENFVKGFEQIDQVSIEDVVKAGGACIGNRPAASTPCRSWKTRAWMKSCCSCSSTPPPRPDNALDRFVRQ